MVLVTFIVILALPVQSQQVEDRNLSSSELFGLFKLLLQDDPSITRDRLNLMVDREKLSKRDDVSWEKVDGRGHFQLSAFFLPDKKSFFLRFFPAVPSGTSPIPTAVLSALSSRSTRIELEGGDTLLLILPDRELSKGNVRGRVTQELIVSLTNGGLVRTNASIEWPGGE